jgi:L-2,4-diaminobutyrate decarboxylase
MMQSLLDAYAPAAFREQGHLLVDRLADHLAAMQAPPGSPVLPATALPDLLADWTARMQAAAAERETFGGVGDLDAFFGTALAQAIHLHHPRYVGHQVSAPAPAAALAGLMAALLNNGMAIAEMGPGVTALERWIIQETAARFGFTRAGGCLTSGGTLGTLTALLAARARQLGPDALEVGTDLRWSIMASQEAHYCTARAVQVMGWGREGLALVPTDQAFRMDVQALQTTYADACARGRRPIALVASVCSTSTGSYDPLGPIADFCAEKGLWLHADGAHGAAVAFAPSLRHKIANLERADSVVLDFHKMLLTPALATAVVFRDWGDSWRAFQQRAHYLYQDAIQEDDFNVGRQSYECTKLMMSLKIAAIWHAHGPRLWRDHLEATHRLATEFAQLIRHRAARGFALAVEPESNIVCFRCQPTGVSDEASDALQGRVRHQLVAAGAFYLVQTVLRGRTWLRTALMNPFTTLDDLTALLDAIESASTVLREPLHGASPGRP